MLQVGLMFVHDEGCLSVLLSAILSSKVLILVSVPRCEHVKQHVSLGGERLLQDERGRVRSIDREKQGGLVQQLLQIVPGTSGGGERSDGRGKGRKMRMERDGRGKSDRRRGRGDISPIITSSEKRIEIEWGRF